VKVTDEAKVHIQALEGATDMHIRNPTAFLVALAGLVRCCSDEGEESDEVPSKPGGEKPSLAVLLGGPREE
jgi:hypothetical protein